VVFCFAESDGYEFLIVSLDSKLWQFEASSYEEREQWVTAIEQQILLSLQGSGSHVEAVRAVLGNSVCVDCSASSKCPLPKHWNTYLDGIIFILPARLEPKTLNVLLILVTIL